MQITALRQTLASQTHSSRTQPPAACACPQAAAWTPATTKKELAAAGGKTVVEIDGKKVLVVAVGEEVFAVSNKCSHLGLPLLGKTKLFTAEVRGGGGGAAALPGAG